MDGETLTDLKPCPYCGRNSSLSVHHLNLNDGFTIYCKKCDMLFQSYIFKRSEEEVIKWWNARNGEPKRLCANCRHFDERCDGQGECHPPKGEWNYVYFDESCELWEAKE